MGSIKNTAIKTLSRDLITKHGKEFSDDFAKNKAFLDKLKNIESKKIRNMVAGCIAKEMKKIKKSGI